MESSMESMRGEPVDELGQARRRLHMLERAASVRIDAGEWLQRSGMAPERVASAASRSKLEQAVLVIPPASPAREGSLGFDVLRAAVLDPAYQLK